MTPARAPEAPRRPPAGEREDLVATTYEALRELIVWGRMAPGARILEREVAKRLGVSRTPVRSALHRLQQEGYVVASGRGSHARLAVAALTSDDVLELFEIVGDVEGLCARRAALLPEGERARLVESLRALNEEFRRAAGMRRQGRMQVYSYDSAFHRGYVEAGAGPRLLALHDAVKPQAERYIRLHIGVLTGELDLSVREHASIIAQIEAGDPEGARRAVEFNWHNAAQRLSSVLEDLGGRGDW